MGPLGLWVEDKQTSSGGKLDYKQTSLVDWFPSRRHKPEDVL